MDRLKGETRDLHTYAETRPLQKALIRGTLPRETYAAYLGQMLLVHATLEAELRSRRSSHRAIAAVAKPYLERESMLIADLESLGIDATSAEALPATQETIAMIKNSGSVSPVKLLGMLYVLEGSTNGSKFIARSLTKAYGIEPGPGLSYLDPYGDRQTDLWQQFKREMNDVGFSKPEMDVLVEAAGRMFQAIADISDQLHTPVPA